MDWSAAFEELRRLAGAFALALPIGWERERASRSAGLRTFPLVAAASCAYVLLGRTFAGDAAEPQARIVAGLMTGIGFVGGGAILKSRGRGRGTATAAGIWMTGAIGAAAGYGRWELAVAMSSLTFVTLWSLTRLERRARARQAPRGAGEVPQPRAAVRVPRVLGPDGDGAPRA